MGVSCNKLDLNKIASGELAPSLAVPLAHANFSIMDIFKSPDINNYVTVDQNSGMVAVYYKGEIFKFSGSDFINLDNFYQPQVYNLAELGGFVTPAFNDVLDYRGTQEIDFRFGEQEQITEFKFDNGQLKFTVVNSFAHSSKVEFSIPNLKKNGIPFRGSVNVTPSSTGSSNFEISQEDLKGYVADLTLNNTAVNKLKVDYHVLIQGNGAPTRSTDKINITASFTNVKVDYAKGYFQTRNIASISDSIVIDMFNQTAGGYFELIDPRIKFLITNSFGIPVNINVGHIRSTNAMTGQIYELMGFNNSIDISIPTQIGQDALTTIYFDKNNTTNISQLISSVPKSLSFAISAKMNKDGVGAVENFVSKDSKIKIEAEIELPLEGLAHSFVIRDTVKFNAPGNIQNLNAVMFRFFVENGFPLDVFAKVRFLDENYNQVFTLWDTQEQLIKSGELNADGKVVKNTMKVSDLKLNAEQLKLLPQIKFVELIAETQTKDAMLGKYIKIYDTYKIGLKLSGQFDIKY